MSFAFEKTPPHKPHLQASSSQINLMRDYITCPKFTTKPRLPDIFSNFLCLRVVFTWVFFSSLLLWELVHDKIQNLHSQTEAW